MSYTSKLYYTVNSEDFDDSFEIREDFDSLTNLASLAANDFFYEHDGWEQKTWPVDIRLWEVYSEGDVEISKVFLGTFETHFEVIPDFNSILKEEPIL